MFRDLLLVATVLFCVVYLFTAKQPERVHILSQPVSLSPALELGPKAQIILEGLKRVPVEARVAFESAKLEVTNPNGRIGPLIEAMLPQGDTLIQQTEPPQLTEAQLEVAAQLSDLELITSYVAGSRVNFRRGPTTESKIQDTFAKGHPLLVIGECRSWKRIVAPDGRAGWMYGKYVSFEVDGLEPVDMSWSGYADKYLIENKARVTGSRVNFRAGPSTKFKIYDTLERGNQVVVIGVCGNWLNVELADGRDGWMYGSYIEQLGTDASKSEMALRSY